MMMKQASLLGMAIGLMGHLVVGSAYATPVSPSSATTDIYFYANAGRVAGKVSQRSLEAALDQTAVQADITELDQSRGGYTLGVGYRLNSEWSVQIGYADLGEVAISLSGLAATPADFGQAVEAIHPLSSKGWTLGGQYQHHWSDTLSSHLIAGGYWWKGEYLTVSGDQTVGADHQGGADPYLGLGTAYQWHDDWALTVEWRRFWFDQEAAELWSAGIRYHF